MYLTMLNKSERLREVSRQRRAREKVELRQAILRTAAELLVEVGYEGFSLRQVAERIGYSATTIYLYFEHKEDLLFAVVDEAFDAFLAALQAVAERYPDPRTRLRELGRTYIRFGLEHPTQYRLMFMERTGYLLRCRPQQESPRIHSFGILRETVQSAIDAGRLRPGSAEQYSQTLWALVHGVVSLAIGMPLDPAAVPALAESALDLAIDGLAP
jgi:AcrR family transcriptional regulator